MFLVISSSDCVVLTPLPGILMLCPLKQSLCKNGACFPSQFLAFLLISPQFSFCLLSKTNKTTPPFRLKSTGFFKIRSSSSKVRISIHNTKLMSVDKSFVLTTRSLLHVGRWKAWGSCPLCHRGLVHSTICFMALLCHS